jgi:diaminopimelate epimerase
MRVAPKDLPDPFAAARGAGLRCGLASDPCSPYPLSQMQLSFTKMHGLGNDFIVFETAGSNSVPNAATLRRLADRRLGIGFDQALVLEPARRAHTDVFYRIFNADGSEVEQCGNGARCIARFISRRARTTGGQADRTELSMDSIGGLVRARLLDDGLVSVDMGVPDFAPAALSFDAAAEKDTYELRLAGTTVEIGVVSMGNPHAVLRVPDVDTAAVDSVGPEVENHPRFANRTNVGFLQVLDRATIRLRVFERGVGETQACGTGACAAVAIGRRWGLLDDRVEVRVPGGQLAVEWRGPGQSVWLTGPAEVAYVGTVEI